MKVELTRSLSEMTGGIDQFYFPRIGLDSIAPLRPVSGNVTIVANPSSPSMVSSSGDGRIMGVAEAIFPTTSRPI